MLAQQRLAGLGLQVERHRALVGVQHRHRQRGVRARRRAPAAGLAVRRLDLDHVGAGLGHQQGGVRALEDLAEIQHSDASQRGVHARRSTEPRTATMRRLRLMRKADSIDAIDLRLETCDPPPRGPDELLIELHAAGVNRSDVAAAMGRMPQAAWPRTPGRDWAGVVLEGPTELVGPGSVRCRRRSRHHPRRHARDASGGAARRGGGEARDADIGGGRRARRAIRHGASRGFSGRACRGRATWCW